MNAERIEYVSLGWQDWGSWDAWIGVYGENGKSGQIRHFWLTDEQAIRMQAIQRRYAELKRSRNDPGTITPSK